MGGRGETESLGAECGVGVRGVVVDVGWAGSEYCDRFDGVLVSGGGMGERNGVVPSVATDDLVCVV